LTSGVWTPLASASGREHDHDAANPVPIPIGSFGFRVNAPGFLTPIRLMPIRRRSPTLGASTAAFDGVLIHNAATMEWSATTANYKFVSQRASTSSSVFAEIAHERNGVFFR